MSDQKTIAIFAASPAQASYLADLARLAGASVGRDDPALALCVNGAAVPSELGAARLCFGQGEGKEGVRVFAGPVKAGVVIAAIRASLQAGKETSSKIRIGDGELDMRDSLWSRGEETLRLTEKEVAILGYLKASGGKPVSREELLHHVWSYVPDVETHTLETHIYRLRQKIETDPSSPKIIVTQGDGYLLPE